MLKTNSFVGRGTVEYVTPSVFVLEIASEGAVLSGSNDGLPDITDDGVENDSDNWN